MKFIGYRAPRPEDAKWSGGDATVAALLRAFADSPEFELAAGFRSDFARLDSEARLLDFISDADIIHADDDETLGKMLSAGFIPDVIGPKTISPANPLAGPDCAYASYAKEFYTAKVVRLNRCEEIGLPDRMRLIRHGVDTDRLRPAGCVPRRYVLWAGDPARRMKNYAMFEAVAQMPLPEPYEWKTIKDYRVRDYWRLLDETALLVVTSEHETFCSAMAEARAKGVPVVYRRGLHGPGVQSDGEFQVEYSISGFQHAIVKLLDDEKALRMAGLRSRQYVEDNFTLRHMRDDLTKVYREVLRDRAGASRTPGTQKGGRP